MSGSESPANRIHAAIQEAGRKHAETGDPLRRTALQLALEQLFVWLMEVLGPIWHATQRTVAGSPAFDCFLKWFPTMACEMLPVRRNPQTNQIELLMIPRSKTVGIGNPPKYAGRLHSPGCMLMWGMNIRKGLDRVVKKETGVPYRVISGLPVNIDTIWSDRGFEVALAFVVALDGDLPADTSAVWVPINDLARLYSEDKIIRAQFENFLELFVAWCHENEKKIDSVLDADITDI